MSDRLESNEYFEEMILLTPLEYEKFKRWREKTIEQTGSGLINAEALESGRMQYEGLKGITDDVNPAMVKKKENYLLATNNVEALTQFKKVLKMQRNLENHFTEGKRLLPGYTVHTLTKEIARLKKKFKVEFDEIIRGPQRTITQLTAGVQTSSEQRPDRH